MKAWDKVQSSNLINLEKAIVRDVTEQNTKKVTAEKWNVMYVQPNENVYFSKKQ